MDMIGALLRIFDEARLEPGKKDAAARTGTR